MQLYNSKEIKILQAYKDTIKDEEIKNIISKLLTNYNIMYIKYRELSKENFNKKELYDQLDENAKRIEILENTIKRKDRLIKILKEEAEQNE